MIRNAFRHLLLLAVFVTIVYVTLGFAIIPKPWYLRALYSLSGTVAGGVVGVVIGLVVGTLGLAFGGSAIALAGWLAFGVIGAGAGTIAGNVVLLAVHPGMVQVRYSVLLLGIVSACVLTICLHALISGWWRGVAIRLTSSQSRT